MVRDRLMYTPDGRRNFNERGGTFLSAANSATYLKLNKTIGKYLRHAARRNACQP